MKFRTFFLLLFGSIYASTPPAPSIGAVLDSSERWDSLGQELKALAEKDILPGFADRELKKVDDLSSVQMLASISKVFIGFALIDAQEQGYFHLDDPVSEYLPFQLEHPMFPDTVTTI